MLLRLRSLHVQREFGVASRNPLVERLPTNPALGAARSPIHVQENGVDLTLTGKMLDPRTGRARYLFCLVDGHPLGVPPDDRRKVAMLATD